MIREIEFMGKDLLTGQSVYGSLLQSEIDVNKLSVQCEIHERFADDFSILRRKVDPKTVGQFTGFHDKNGDKVFENQIVSDGQDAYAVKWNNLHNCWGLFSGDYFHSEILCDTTDEKGRTPTIWAVLGYEIIGNIHEEVNLGEQ